MGEEQGSTNHGGLGNIPGGGRGEDGSALQAQMEDGESQRRG